MSLLWVTAQDKEEADRCKAKLDEYRWTLRLSSKSADFLERAISMLATSTGVLVKAIPEKPDTEYFLTRHSRMLATSSIGATNSSENPSQMQAAARGTESDAHDEFGNETDIGETPSTSGATSGDYMSDHLWFAGNARIGNFGAVYGEVGTVQSTYLGIGDTPNGYGFSGFSDQGQIGESES